MRGPSLLLPALFAAHVSAQVTVYKPLQQVIFNGVSSAASSTVTAAAASYTGAAAYNTTQLQPPAVPNPAINTTIDVALTSGALPVMSLAQSGAFFGFSIEMSVVNQMLGKNSSFIQVPFLNLLSNVAQRAGWVQVRVGGNTQETAVVVDTLPDGKILQKDVDGASSPSATPPLDITPDMFYLMANISTFVNARWWSGLPFFNTTPFDLTVVQVAQSILGDKLLGMQAANEPDLYASHDHRNATYQPADYVGELFDLNTQMSAKGIDATNLLVVPSVSSDWTVEQVLDAGLLQNNAQNVNTLAVEHYPENNCVAVFGTDGTALDPQTEFPNYLVHSMSTGLIANYVNASAQAQLNGKGLMLFETNTASCAGFPGISNSFGAALWALDWSFTLAANNFTGALFHSGGQGAYYNPFTPPPTNQSSFRQWTVGPVYYSALAMAEALGPRNKSQVADLNLNGGNVYTPGYLIAEAGVPTKIALINFISDATGAQAYTAQISVSGMNLQSVKVKYLLADSVAQIGNFTWAGQTFGVPLSSDGRPEGDLNVTTVQCVAGSCAVYVPAPAFALVFLNDDDYNEVTPASAITFSTSTQTQVKNTITVDMAALETSNGHAGLASAGLVSSFNSANKSGASSVAVPPALGALGMVALTALWFAARAR
ncbi:unnamed protein product [Peniophora sp. CBMAI 1063]|nr:unnamed protein product [Peniophora sp. CBMAI 1063]